MTLRDRGIALERKLEGDDRRTVHQLGLMLDAYLHCATAVDEASEVFDAMDDDCNA
jgi:hypothetical protein